MNMKLSYERFRAYFEKKFDLTLKFLILRILLWAPETRHLPKIIHMSV